MLAWHKGFYGPTITLSALLAYICIGGGYYGMSVFAPVMAADLGWSAAQFGAAFSIMAITSGLSAPFTGAFVSRFGPRLAMFVGPLLAGTAFALQATTQERWQFYALTAVMSMGISLGAYLPVQQLVGNWFIRRRSLVFGLVLSGSATGGFLVVSLSSRLIQATGSWRPAWLALAGLMLVPASLALLFIRNRPDDLGQRADGAPNDPAVTATARPQELGSHVYRSKYQWSVKAAMRTRTFWLVALATGTMFFLFHATTAHQVAYLSGEAGLELTVAASAVGLMIGLSILGRITAGWLGDRTEPRMVLAGLLLLQALSLLILLTRQGVVSLYLFVLLFGLSYGGIIVLSPAVIINYFGSRNFAAIQGISMPVGTFLGALSPVLVGGIKDASGSYVPAFVMLVGVAIVGATCALLARPPVPPDAAPAEVAGAGPPRGHLTP